MEGYARYDSLLSSTHAFPIIYFASIDLDLRCCEAGVNNANILLVLVAEAAYECLTSVQHKQWKWCSAQRQR